MNYLFDVVYVYVSQLQLKTSSKFHDYSLFMNTVIYGFFLYFLHVTHINT